MKLTSAQSKVIEAMKAGGTLTMSRRSYDSFTKYLNGKKVSSMTVDKLLALGAIRVGEEDPLELKFKLP